MRRGAALTADIIIRGGSVTTAGVAATANILYHSSASNDHNATADDKKIFGGEPQMLEPEGPRMVYMPNSKDEVLQFESDYDNCECSDSEGSVESILEGSYTVSSNKNNLTGSKVSASFCDMMASSLLSSPPTVAETEGAIDSLRANPDILTNVVPLELINFLNITKPHMMNSLFEKVRENIAKSPHFIQQAREAQDKYVEAEESADKDFNAMATLSDQSDLQRQWDELASRHPCAICQDLLAAPHILRCEHSFCWKCIEEMISKCTSQELDVVHTCPTCREEMLINGIFERTLDNTICAEVISFPASECKAQWQERRDCYMKNVEKSKSKGSRRVRSDGGDERPASSEESNEEDEVWWQSMIALVTFAVVAVIAVVRASR